jgi:hypothetical protein
MKKVTGMNPKASFGNVSQQAAGYYTPLMRDNSANKLPFASLLKLSLITLRFAGLFNFPIPLRFASGIEVSRIKKNFYGIILISLFVIFGFMEFPMQAQAIEPKMTDILITNNAENVLLYARLVNGFKPDMELAVLAGIPATFILQLEVYQVRSFAWDKKIITHEIKRTIKYDNLKKTFSVYTNGNTQPVVFSDFESAQKAMADFNGIIAVSLASLLKDNNYYLLIKVKMDKARLPLHMENVFFFVSYWDFETAWERQNFSY